VETISKHKSMAVELIQINCREFQTDRQGRTSKCGDTFTRTCRYEAAHVLLTRVHRFSPLKAWGMR
jgi:hypothetical protein